MRPTTTPETAKSGPTQVLVIDDSDVDRESMKELLLSGGFAVETLPSPIGATRAVRRTGARLVIIDQNMPVMDGNKLATLFRDNPGMRGVRVVLVSGNDPSVMEEVARQAHADAFVSKGVLHRDLVATVRRLLAG
jgi:CheY-like chemotaxis protein